MPVKSVAEIIADLYESFQAAVEVYGGVEALACAMKKSKGDISLRVRRAPDSKGEIKRSSLDMVAHVAEDLQARHRFVSELMKRWFYKQPELAVEPTVEEKYRQLLSRLSGTSGDAILKYTAESAGWDPAVFRRG